jgi:aconitate hydratase 2/2-methylisocitrate dehydratase
VGGKIAPIFFNTMEDAGSLPIEADVDKLEHGAVVDLLPYAGEIRDAESAAVLSKFNLRSDVLLDEVRAGGRINLIIGRGLTERARAHLGTKGATVFASVATAQNSKAGFTLAQKMVGRACGIEGVRPGQYCEPRMSTVGSQDTTGPMTRNELKDLACLGFSSDLVMQSFCHTAAYPKPIDIDTQHTLPDFMINRGGVSLRPGDGIIHSWLNRMLLPDTVGTGGDSHTRFPIGISFPAGSGLVAFAAAVGVMPLDMPESVRVRFHGQMQPGITLRDLVNAIPYVAKQHGLLTLEKKGKKNIFSGNVLEIEGLPNLKIEQAFEFSDASAERSSAGCTILLDEAPIREYLESNVVLLRWMIQQGYRDARTLDRRIKAMEAWLAKPELMRPDKDADYLQSIDIDLDMITEPLLACPNDPDDIRPLSEVCDSPIDEVFIGSCMTNIGHYRAASRVLESTGDKVAAKLWIAPPTRMDEQQLMQEGHYNVYGRVGARTEMPGCSLCMGNQARVADGASVVSTSTRNFPNRLGKDANVYLASAELAAVCAALGKIPDHKTYLQHMSKLDPNDVEVYRYLNFNEIKAYIDAAERAKNIPLEQIEQASV